VTGRDGVAAALHGGHQGNLVHSQQLALSWRCVCVSVCLCACLCVYVYVCGAKYYFRVNDKCITENYIVSTNVFVMLPRCGHGNWGHLQEVRE
jgi:hypothetical protein